MRRLVLTSAIVVAGLVASGCGESSSRIVSNSDERTYFKLPREYTTFELPTGRQDRLSPASPEDVELIWSRGFDASATAAITNVAAAGDFTIAVEAPVGVASVYLVQGGFNQNLSLAGVRGVPLGFDPMNVPDDVKDLVEIVEFTPASRDDGLQGSRVIFNMRPDSASAWRTYDMTTYFDPGRFRMYTFTIGCLSPCFKEREREIRDIASSWRIEP